MYKKEISFIYMDSAEKSFMDVLASEAAKRGYETKVTNDKFVRSEIGIYCQHVNFPQFSKFSVIMLHDIIQQYGHWPDLWLREPWHKYDVGILPSDQWVNNWTQCSSRFYARPRKGMYKVGWPKADVVAGIDFVQYREDFYKEYGLDPDKKTVLYAPAWENDHKQDDFVKAMQALPVNMLVKQWDADPEKFPEVVKNIKEMAELHKNVPGLTILPPSMNIFNAIMAADILVSEESSTMSEAAMLGIPAVSVSDWLIPDVTPSRLPECNYDFVTMTKKESLTDTVSDMLAHYETFKKDTEEYAAKNFANVGKASEMIMDIIDDYAEGRSVRYEALDPGPRKAVGFKTFCFWLFTTLKREIHDNYCERSKVLMAVWRCGRYIKRKITGEEI